jgi:hypothetical protein
MRFNLIHVYRKASVERSIGWLKIRIARMRAISCIVGRYMIVSMYQHTLEAMLLFLSLFEFLFVFICWVMYR